MSETNIFVSLVEALDPVIQVVLDLLFFPLNAIIGFIWGGIKELITSILFG